MRMQSQQSPPEELLRGHRYGGGEGIRDGIIRADNAMARNRQQRQRQLQQLFERDDGSNDDNGSINISGSDDIDDNAQQQQLHRMPSRITAPKNLQNLYSEAVLKEGNFWLRIWRIPVFINRRVKRAEFRKDRSGARWVFARLRLLPSALQIIVRPQAAESSQRRINLPLYVLPTDSSGSKQQLLTAVSFGARIGDCRTLQLRTASSSNSSSDSYVLQPVLAGLTTVDNADEKLQQWHAKISSSLSHSAALLEVKHLLRELHCVLLPDSITTAAATTATMTTLLESVLSSRMFTCAVGALPLAYRQQLLQWNAHRALLSALSSNVATDSERCGFRAASATVLLLLHIVAGNAALKSSLLRDCPELLQQLCRFLKACTCSSNSSDSDNSSDNERATLSAAVMRLLFSVSQCCEIAEQVADSDAIEALVEHLRSTVSSLTATSAAAVVHSLPLPPPSQQQIQQQQQVQQQCDTPAVSSQFTTSLSSSSSNTNSNNNSSSKRSDAASVGLDDPCGLALGTLNNLCALSSKFVYRFLVHDGLAPVTLLLRSEAAAATAAVKEKALLIVLTLILSENFKELQRVKDMQPVLAAFDQPLVPRALRSKAVLCLANIRSNTSTTVATATSFTTAAGEATTAGTGEDEVSGALLEMLQAALRGVALDGVLFDLYPVLCAVQSAASRLGDLRQLRAGRVLLEQLANFVASKQAVLGSVLRAAATAGNRSNIVPPYISKVPMAQEEQGTQLQGRVQRAFSTMSTQQQLQQKQQQSYVVEVDLALNIMMHLCDVQENLLYLREQMFSEVLRELHALIPGWTTVSGLYTALNSSNSNSSEELLEPGSVADASGSEVDGALQQSSSKATAAVVAAAAEEAASAEQWVMISYCWKNQSTALALAQLLRERGIEYWLDVEHMGCNLEDSMATAVEGAAAVLCLLSPDYALSGNCRKEARYAINLRRRVVPLMVQSLQLPLSGWLGMSFQDLLYHDVGVDCTNSAGVKSLLKALTSSLQRKSIAITGKHHTAADTATAGVVVAAGAADLFDQQQQQWLCNWGSFDVDAVGALLQQQQLGACAEMFAAKKVSGNTLFAWKQLSTADLKALVAVLSEEFQFAAAGELWAVIGMLMRLPEVHNNNSTTFAAENSPTTAVTSVGRGERREGAATVTATTARGRVAFEGLFE